MLRGCLLDNRILAALAIALLAVGVAAGYEVRSLGGTTTVSTTTVIQPTTETTTFTTTFTFTEPAPGEIPSITAIEEGNTSIKGYPSSIAVNYATGMLYVTDIFSNALTIVNGTTNRIAETITLPATPTGIVVDSSTNTVFISIGDCTNEVNASNSCSSTQSVLTQPEILAMNGSTNRVLWTTRANAMVVAVDEYGGLLYATQSQMTSPVVNSTGSLLALSASSGILMANTSLPASPGGVTFDRATNMLYVSACKTLGLVCGGAEVLVVNGTDHAISTTIPVSGWGFSGMILDPVTDTGYLAVYSNVTTLVSIDLSSDKQVHSTVLGSTCADIHPVGVGLSEGQLYAVASGEGSPDNLLLVIDGPSGSIINMFSSPGQFVGVASDLSNGMLYATIEPLSTHQTSGSLISLSGSFPVGFVNTGLIASGVCLP
jgi:hypothetical protein